MVREIAKEAVLRAVGNSVGVTLPKAVLDNLHLKEGDKMMIVETHEGILLRKYDPLLAKAMKAYEESARRYWHAMRVLADK